MKNFPIIFLILSIFILLFVGLDSVQAAYPDYTRSSDLVSVGPYNVSATAGGGNWGKSGANSTRDFITIGHRYRIRQDGILSRIGIYCAYKTGITGFYIKVWRKNASSTYDLVGTSNNLVNDLVVGASMTIDFSSPITNVQEGDYVGYRLEIGADGSAAQFYAFTSQTGVTSYLTDSDPTSINYQWESVTSSYSGTVLPIELYMQAPAVVGIGDSIMSGSPNSRAFLVDSSPSPEFNGTTTILGNLKALTGYVYQNMGIGSQTSAQIAARFAADVVNLKPKLVIVEAGVNDIALSVTKSTFITNYTSILTAAQNSSYITHVVVFKILPWSNGTNAQMQTRDDWNSSLATLAAGYSKAILVDASSYVGQFRAGGDAGNLWDIQAAYNADGVHFTPSGHAQIAQAITDIIDSLPNTPLNIKTNSTINPSELTNTTPTLSAEYDDTEPGDIAAYYQVQVIEDGGSWSSPLWDSGKTATNVVEGSRQESLYRGTSLFLNRMKYYQRWRFWDDEGLVSPWSDGTDYWVMQYVPQNLSNWLYRKKIIINGSQASSTLSNFPVLIDLSSDADLASKALDSGNDILFTSSSINWSTNTDNDRLRHEIEKFDGSTGQLVAWVKIPSLSSATNTEIYMYYGNMESGNQESSTSVWDDSYKGVWHLKDSNNANDSTLNANNGTIEGDASSTSSGKIGYAFQFGGDDYVSVGSDSSLNITQQVTVSGWVNTTLGEGTIFSSDFSSFNNGYWLGYDANNYLFLYIDNVYNFYRNPIFSYGSWVYFVGTYDGSKLILYKNGSEVGRQNASGVITNNGTGAIGKAQSYLTTGLIDEVNVSNTARSAAWILTSYNNQNSPSTFYSLGSEDGYPIAPTISTPTVLSSSAIRWSFTDNSSYETGFRVYTNADAIATSSAIANLTYLDETGLSENTQYTRYVKAYNSYGESASSSATSTYTLVDTPTGFNFMRHPSSLDIYVDAFPNSNSGSSGYLFWRTDNSAYNSGWIQTNNWQDPNMVEGTTYTYAVKYRNGNGVETATTTMGGVSFVRDNGGGGTVTIPQQTTSTSSVQATITLSNTTSTIQATSTQATSTVSFEKPISQMSREELIAKITQITQMIAQLQLLIANSISTIPNTFSFKDTLKQGMADIAVKYLQIILNQYPDTQVAQTGVGSSGKETNYFGLKTKQAVIKFQEKYKDTILEPLGLINGTGIVGKTTKAKLNQLLGK